AKVGRGNVLSGEGPAHDEHPLAVDVPDGQTPKTLAIVEPQGILEVPGVGRTADREDGQASLAMMAWGDLDGDFLEPVLSEAQEDAEVVSRPLNEAVDPFDAFPDQPFRIPVQPDHFLE